MFGVHASSPTFHRVLPSPRTYCSTSAAKMSDIASLSAPDSPWYTRPAVFSVTPWVISCAAMSSATSGPDVQPSPSPYTIADPFQKALTYALP